MSVNHQSKCATVVASAVIVVTVLILLQYSISVPLFFYMVLICKPHQPIELSILSHLGKMNLMRRTEGTSIFIVPKMIHTGLKNRLKYFRIFSKVKKLFKYANHSPKITLILRLILIIFQANLEERPIVHDVVFVLLLSC